MTLYLAHLKSRTLQMTSGPKYPEISWVNSTGDCTTMSHRSFVLILPPVRKEYKRMYETLLLWFYHEKLWFDQKIVLCLYKNPQTQGNCRLSLFNLVNHCGPVKGPNVWSKIPDVKHTKTNGTTGCRMTASWVDQRHVETSTQLLLRTALEFSWSLQLFCPSELVCGGNALKSRWPKLQPHSTIWRLFLGTWFVNTYTYAWHHGHCMQYLGGQCLYM